MSFSSDVKKEIGKINNLAKKDQVKFELIGYMLSSNIAIRKSTINFSTSSDYNINRYSKLLSNLGINHDIKIAGNLFSISSKFDEIDFINIANKKILIKDEYKKNILIQSEDNKRAVVRGMFLGSGSINNPENKYHFMISFQNKENMNFAKKIFETFEINIKILDNDGKFGLYLKEGEEISKILALMGANTAVMKFEDIRISREMRGKINRLVNCESANLNKTLNASVEQIEAINKLKKEKRFSKLNDNLREIAILRIENPDMSLTELGKMANPPVGKSGVNYRLKKIMEIANE